MFLVLAGRCLNSDRTPPFLFWIWVLRPIQSARPFGGASGTLGPAGSAAAIASRQPEGEAEAGEGTPSTTDESDFSGSEGEAKHGEGVANLGGLETWSDVGFETCEAGSWNLEESLPSTFILI